MLIRPYERQDWDSVWAILEPVFRAGETYAFPLDISEEDARRAWTSKPKEVFVAVDPATGQLLGTYYLKPNHDGPGSHVCNCGYVVSENARGRGVATRMCEHSQAEAASRGYRAMQYNLVAASNVSAARLWKKLGFAIVGTLPGAFRNARLGFVDAHVMYKPLGSASSAWPWPDFLDALIAAPRHHTLMFENARVRVLDTRIPPGETVPVHTHRWPMILHVLSWGAFVRRDGDGNILVDTRSVGSVSEPLEVMWSAAFPPHSLENVGQSEIHVINVELKDEATLHALQE